jgi:predicted metal-dependent RNase
MERKPEHVFVVHGEGAVSEAFAGTLLQQGIPNTYVPHLNESFAV